MLMGNVRWYFMWWILCKMHTFFKYNSYLKSGSSLQQTTSSRPSNVQMTISLVDICFFFRFSTNHGQLEFFRQMPRALEWVSHGLPTVSVWSISNSKLSVMRVVDGIVQISIRQIHNLVKLTEFNGQKYMLWNELWDPFHIQWTNNSFTANVMGSIYHYARGMDYSEWKN